DRSVRALSGGQRQRVAIARALAVRPRVLLLDEPLAALDPQLRHELRARLVELIRASGVTTLFVTHDQAEALAVADRIAVMDAGRIAQFGTPQELWERPRNAFVARFLSAATIVTTQHIGGNRVQIAPGLAVSLPEPISVSPGAEVQLALRPGELRWGSAGSTATAAHVTYAGGVYHVMAATPDGTLLPCTAEAPVQIGAVGSVGVRPDARMTVVQP
ncbi:MAG: ABC transporter ATP-binding protein, partial [Oscillochloris sp.]|nr:ABC transporter ATP-binding protein [Oscillochloris sp.]